MTMMNIDDIFDLSIWTIDNKIIICETYYHQPISDSDDGFIIGTWGGTIIKTDSELNYEE